MKYIKTEKLIHIYYDIHQYIYMVSSYLFYTFKEI